MNTVPTDTSSKIPLSVPEIGGNEWKYIKECLDTGWVSSVGPFVNRFEKEFASFVGADEAVAVSNGTVALHVALRMIGVEPDDEVLVPDLTFVAPINAVTYCQAHPVFIDVDPVDWQIDVLKVSRFLESECIRRGDECINKTSGRRVRAILPVHLLGLACRMDAITELANQHHLSVVEDAAEAVGVRYKGRYAGTFGDVGAFSFNGNKIITAGSGGMVVTNNRARAEYARYITTQAKDDPIEYIHEEVGYNYRLSNLHAAMGVAQLERVHEFLERKRKIARIYEAAFENLEGITCMPCPDNVEAAFWLYAVLLPPGTTLERRKKVIAALNDHGIGARSFWHTIHDLTPYRNSQNFQIEHSVDLYTRGICLPSSVGLTESDQARCIDTFKKVIHSDNARR
jgi:perosamine synthetase